MKNFKKFVNNKVETNTLNRINQTAEVYMSNCFGLANEQLRLVTRLFIVGLKQT